jgi:hypothetical protein
MRAPIYTVVTFGMADEPPSGLDFSWTRDLDKARSKARAARGSGTCTAARVYACESVSLARSADIGRVRDGERIVFSA